ncbi:hypothetical protein HYH38_08360 [Clostridium botulinum]|uniref:hypothetical protein n=2 Tax=Clostridium botulinum TaxID=1491 RepID=UPI001C9A62CE|nr:hypothetical protein [Clostridium botulinum]MBY6816453.1 hypothetical protein [Clostridium botulinum]MBY6827292.1 hypothetical protein [Clostridium botulinum]MBY6859240.1 hypothetical protein [Clostridium botulinum]MBY7041476.1 hypothetical protein [Clostridium botulinum]
MDKRLQAILEYDKIFEKLLGKEPIKKARISKSPAIQCMLQDYERIRDEYLKENKKNIRVKFRIELDEIDIKMEYKKAIVIMNSKYLTNIGDEFEENLYKIDRTVYDYTWDSLEIHLSEVNEYE